MTQPDQVLRSPKERRTVESAVRALSAVAPPGWRRLTFAFYATVGIDSASLEAVCMDGGTRTLVPPGRAMRYMDELRTATYRRDKGAWFTARLDIERSGRYSVEFDYEGEPDFTPPLTASSYALDLDRFPRSNEHTPAWLRDKLREAMNEAG
ncbi:hypothetical protein [Thermomonospora umbrina]|uniref:Uncharacterized protein n=1 Tax=Thermomonospora umbrina TaxID=111806 RepID=A0A3D9T6B6_9ACTN|nr:hypothetical protein [Thermomonospora umbrina]REE99291.1 hypothetical protein DFJ69_4800 [Thermomonospora umbrina]